MMIFKDFLSKYSIIHLRPIKNSAEAFLADINNCHNRHQATVDLKKSLCTELDFFYFLSNVYKCVNSIALIECHFLMGTLDL